MGWFAGFFPGLGALSPRDWPPPGGRTLWAGPRALSALGRWAPYELHTLERADARLAVFGPCFADQRRIALDFAAALPRRRYESLTRWPGSYVVVVSDSDGVTIFTDLAGQCPVFMTAEAQGVAYCSRARPLADRRGAQPDTERLAADLICPQVPEAHAGASPYRGVRVLGGGRLLRLTRHGLRQRVADALAPDAGARFGEAADALRAALTAAVHARMAVARRPTADLSGGLDSTSLAFLAVSCGAAGLPAFTYDNPLAPSGEDLACARRAAALEPRLDHRVLTGGAKTLPYQELAEAPPSDEPDTGVILWPRTRVRWQAALAAGSDLHLSGNGGDAVLAAPLAALADLARPRHARALLAHCAAWGTLRHRPPVALLYAAHRLARTSRSQALHDLAAQLVTPPAGSLNGLARPFERTLAWWTPLGQEVHWVTAQARRELAERLMQGAAEAQPIDGIRAGDHAAVSDLRAYAAGQRLDREAAAAIGLSLHAPYLDNEVVRACMRVPARLRLSPSTAKPVLGAALQGLVPDSVLTRRTKGDYTGEEYQGIRRAVEALRGLLTNPLAAEFGLVEPRPLLAALDQAVAGLPVPFAALRRVLAVEVWLRRIMEDTLTAPEATVA